MSCFILVLILGYTEGFHERNTFLVAFIDMLVFWECLRSFLCVLQSGFFPRRQAEHTSFFYTCAAVSSP